MFLFSNQTGPSTLYDRKDDYEKFENLLNSKHAMEPQFYRTTNKQNNVAFGRIIHSSRPILTARSKRVSPKPRSK